MDTATIANSSQHAHTHRWRTTSRHFTSDGTIGYQHCSCGSHRVVAMDRASELLATIDHR
ncbi:MAG: hypothetical protein WBB62_06605 [Rhodococcus sp. (in: high G+C Gram-positive bacteria)]|uniref:hypothetical protein n=1 Tax=Nocardiaceae TaxID=85025 RepID=UPI001E37B13F|nr:MULTISPECIES: hypothetical protein [Rhodococcus]MCC8926178.1 hypothetical protein [Rhodococcus sp. I2R]MCZ4274570.1 hypothetical protein [Rhodococcus yunnanensis]